MRLSRTAAAAAAAKHASTDEAAGQDVPAVDSAGSKDPVPESGSPSVSRSVLWGATQLPPLPQSPPPPPRSPPPPPRRAPTITLRIRKRRLQHLTKSWSWERAGSGVCWVPHPATHSQREWRLDTEASELPACVKDHGHRYSGRQLTCAAALHIRNIHTRPACTRAVPKLTPLRQSSSDGYEHDWAPFVGAAGPPEPQSDGEQSVNDPGDQVAPPPLPPEPNTNTLTTVFLD